MDAPFRLFFKCWRHETETITCQTTPRREQWTARPNPRDVSWRLHVMGKSCYSMVTGSKHQCRITTPMGRHHKRSKEKSPNSSSLFRGCTNYKHGVVYFSPLVEEEARNEQLRAHACCIKSHRARGTMQHATDIVASKRRHQPIPVSTPAGKGWLHSKFAPSTERQPPKRAVLRGPKILSC